MQAKAQLVMSVSEFPHSIEETATYNLKAVVQETGLKPDTLRAWERRYDLPTPKRTSGGHRLYSQRDIETLKWLIERQEDGLSISRAVDLWNTYLAENKDPLAEMPLQGSDLAEMAPVPVGDTIVSMRQAWIDACLKYNEAAADNIAAQAFALYPPETVVMHVFQQGLAQIGIGWFEGQVTAQQEHFASALAMRRLEGLVASTPPPTRPGRILVGCPPEEEHTFAPLLITYLLRRRSWEALYLGANVPTARMEATITATDPALVILSAQTLHTASTLLDMAELLHEQGVNVAFGGMVFNNRPILRRRIPGHFLGTQIDQVPQAVERLINAPRVTGAANAVPDSYVRAHDEFIQHQAQMEARVWDLLRTVNITATELARANRDMANSIIAALRLGDIELVGTDLHWLQALLTNYHYRIKPGTLTDYLEAYHQAAAETLGPEGEPLIVWLEEIISS